MITQRRTPEIFQDANVRGVNRAEEHGIGISFDLVGTEELELRESSVTGRKIVYLFLPLDDATKLCEMIKNMMDKEYLNSVSESHRKHVLPLLQVRGNIKESNVNDVPVMIENGVDGTE